MTATGSHATVKSAKEGERDMRNFALEDTGDYGPAVETARSYGYEGDEEDEAVFHLEEMSEPDVVWEVDEDSECLILWDAAEFYSLAWREPEAMIRAYAEFREEHLLGDGTWDFDQREMKDALVGRTSYSDIRKWYLYEHLPNTDDGGPLFKQLESMGIFPTPESVCEDSLAEFFGMADGGWVFRVE